MSNDSVEPVQGDIKARLEKTLNVMVSAQTKRVNMGVWDCDIAAVNDALKRIEELEAQVERLKSPARECYHEEGCPHWVEVSGENHALKAQLAAMREALLKYGSHTFHCRHAGGYDCNCGFEELRARAKESSND